MFATIVVIKSNDMNNKRVRKDFMTEIALEKFLAKNEQSGAFDVVEWRYYS